MPDEVADLREGAVAYVTLVGLALLVNATLVLLEGAELCEGLRAQIALVGAFSCVRARVLREGLLTVEGLLAVENFTLVCVLVDLFGLHFY